MKALIVSVTFLISMLGCSEHTIKKSVYESAASHQCAENFKNNPYDANDSTSCTSEKEIEGRSYDEYVKAKNSEK
ncbi:hypothetical protein [Agarilytica rhodophyticola]|uniref:hypothetical protein n=1 Tax=Agarilytica rhodophyticola TaxID=1737490 RepID=UPI000B342F37|nr:hypothetical protein [Agarilytica rhodophyticola]